MVYQRNWSGKTKRVFVHGAGRTDATNFIDRFGDARRATNNAKYEIASPTVSIIINSVVKNCCRLLKIRGFGRFGYYLYVTIDARRSARRMTTCPRYAIHGQ